MNLRINILDKYIIKKFIGTYFFAILIFIVIVIIFDISEKIDEFVEKGATLEGIVFQYYANFIPYFMNMFNPLFVFIAVIFFTSKLASHSEIIAMLAGGVSFKRLLYPYFLSSLVIALLSLFLNLVVIPPANKVRLEFQENYISDKYVNTNRDIHFQLSPGTYVYMESFNSWNNTASRFTLETIQGHTIVSKLSAETAVWDTTIQGWKLYNYFLRKNNEMGVDISSGKTLDTVINLSIKDLNQRENIVESYNYNELNDLIDTQKLRGDKRVIYAQIEKNTRFALPFSAFILTLIGVSLSSRKRKGGIGMNIGIGLVLSFSYILFLRFSQMFVHAGVLPPWIALWVPNMLYALISVFLYRIAPK
ncbi:MAG: LptF/LptG family permease [Bacteroidales bacterium]|jgi:lipopolysaccharide export system permease protein|nr:LptF/LptG family permease [Bacteroidales bacterium]